VTVDQTTHIATADVVYHGAAIRGGDGNFDITFNIFGTVLSTTNEISTGSWSILGSGTTVSGFSAQQNVNTTILSEGQRVFTVNFQLASNDSSFLFSTSEVLLGQNSTA